MACAAGQALPSIAVLDFELIDDTQDNNPATLAAQRVVVVGMQFDSPARHTEGAGHPVGRQAQDALPLVQGVVHGGFADSGLGCFAFLHNH